jgi:hypothetical protein
MKINKIHFSPPVSASMKFLFYTGTDTHVTVASTPWKYIFEALLEFFLKLRWTNPLPRVQVPGSIPGAPLVTLLSPVFFSRNVERWKFDFRREKRGRDSYQDRIVRLKNERLRYSSARTIQPIPVRLANNCNKNFSNAPSQYFSDCPYW